MDQIYELVLDHLSSYSHTAGYPELIVPALAQVTPLLSHPTSPQSFYSPSITLCNSSETPHHKKRLLTVLYSVYWWRFTNVTSPCFTGDFLERKSCLHAVSSINIGVIICIL